MWAFPMNREEWVQGRDSKSAVLETGGLTGYQKEKKLGQAIKVLQKKKILRSVFIYL